MAPAVVLEPTTSYGRPHTSSGLLDESSFLDSTDFASFDIPSFDLTPDFDTKLNLDTSETTLANDPKSSTVVTERPSREQDDKPKLLRRYSLADRRKSWLPTSKSTGNVKDYFSERPNTAAPDMDKQGGLKTPSTSAPELGAEAEKPNKVTGGFVKFARRNLIPGSRSPSPQRHRDASPSAAEPQGTLSRVRAASNSWSSSKERLTLHHRRSSSNLNPETPPLTDVQRSTPRAFSRATSYFSKMKTKSQIKLAENSNSESDNSCASSATTVETPTTTFTIEHMGTIKTASFVDGETAPTSNPNVDPIMAQDPLWNSFKQIELEVGKLDDKTTLQRMQAIKLTLVPFLRNNSNHSSNKKLRLENVDRRTAIFDKWWKLLLEMLGGRGQQPLPGVDRPVLLDITLMIMMRPEWRQATTSFMALEDRSPAERVRARSWTQSTGNSLTLSQAEFLTDSVEHNVRTMFVNNLLAQLSLVTDKMSMPHAPTSLVNFCGKTCAYAFFFAPGAAEALVRLWMLTPDAVRRAADALKLPKRDNGESEDMVALFPHGLGSLGWTDARKVSQRLKVIPKLPVAVATIQWSGPWLTKWRGRDTDLFFIFCKYFHILSEEFMPAGLPLVEKARSPAFVLVQAQLLTVLETTIYRQPGMDSFMGLAAGDSSYGVDASAMALGAMTNGNVLKGMSENRLIVLLRDFLSENTFYLASARHTFAECFISVLGAAVSKISLYDHHACMVLCDFLEEALIPYTDMEDGQVSGLSYIDWTFWLDVVMKMTGSLNIMTQVRLLSFIYMTWDVVAADPRRKEALCLGWLLTEKTFNDYFNHWSPLVRAYYLRLLCWRICRDTGSANEVDATIFLTVSSRLTTAWSHYMYLKEAAEMMGKFPPTTTPCLPTPGKKFMIVRTEVNPPQPGLFMGFDAITRSINGADQTAGSRRNDDSISGGLKGDGKKRWSLLGKVLSLNAGSAGIPGMPVRPEDDELEQARKNVAASRSAGHVGPQPPPKNANASASTSSDGSSTGSSPIYQEQGFIFKFQMGLHFDQPFQPRERVLIRPRLPAPAQAWVSARTRSADTPPPFGAKMPAPTRLVSGLKEGGLVNNARNASPLGSPISASLPNSPRVGGDAPPKLTFSASLVHTFSEPLEQPGPDTETCSTSDKSTAAMSMSTSNSGGASSESRFDRRRAVSPELIAQAAKPTGIYATNAVYSGRALAEWGVIVAECNGFIDRRRDEGVLGLADIEVPTLEIERTR